MVYLLLDMTHNERQLLQALRYTLVDYCVEPQNIDITLCHYSTETFILSLSSMVFSHKNALAYLS